MNTNIAMQDISPQFDSPVNALAKVLQIKQAQQEGQMGQMKMDEYRRGLAGDNALAQLLAGGKSGADVATGLAAQGYGNKSMDYTKQLQAMEKEKAATEKDQLANTMQKLAIGAQILGSVTDQQSYDQARATAQAHGLDVSRMQPTYDPQFVDAKRKEGQTMAQQIEQYWKQKGYDTPDANAVLQAQTSRDNNSATVGATVRGQNMVDARSREATAATMSKPFEVTGPDGSPVLVQQNKQGQIVPVTGYSPKTAADKPLTDAQSKAALFGSRMQAANQVLDSLATDGTTTSIPGARTGFGVGAVLNTVSSAKQQQLNQAKRDFVNAVLRRESGAVIADSEFANADQQYFPQVGDSKEVIAQKKANREIAIRGIQAEVPKGQRKVINEIIGGNPIDSLLDKYK